MTHQRASGTRVAFFVTGLVYAALAIMLFALVPLAHSAMSMSYGAEKSISGDIVGVHNSTRLTEVAIREPHSNFAMNVLLAPYEKVTVCGKNDFAKDLNPGDKATIRYHELSGLAVGDKISEQC